MDLLEATRKGLPQISSLLDTALRKLSLHDNANIKRTIS